MLHGSCNAIGGQNAVIKLRWGSRPRSCCFKGAPPGIKFALGENAKRSNFRVPRRAALPAARAWASRRCSREGFLRARGLQAASGTEYEARPRRAGKADKPVPPRRDLRLEALAEILDGKRLSTAHCYRADEILMLMRLADEFGFKVRTFQHVLEGYKIATRSRSTAPASHLHRLVGVQDGGLDAIPYNAAIMREPRRARRRSTPTRDELARRLYWDAAKAVKYGGVSEPEALKMSP